MSSFPIDREERRLLIGTRLVPLSEAHRLRRALQHAAASMWMVHLQLGPSEERREIVAGRNLIVRLAADLGAELAAQAQDARAEREGEDNGS